MAEQAIINTSTLTSIGDAIRTKTGKSDIFLPSEMPSEILAIETGSDVSGVTAETGDVRSGKKFINSSGTLVNGTLTTRNANSLAASGATVTVPAGIYDSQVTKSVGEATQATPEIMVSANGSIIAYCNQGKGYLSGGETRTTLKLSSSHDSNFVRDNIKNGVTIFGLTGKYVGDSPTASSPTIKWDAGWANNNVVLIQPTPDIGTLYGFAISYFGTSNSGNRYLVTIAGDAIGAAYEYYNDSEWSNHATGKVNFTITSNGIEIPHPDSLTFTDATIGYSVVIYDPA